MESLRAVCVGGGLGAPTAMAGPRAYTDDITGLIAVTDSGRSTGKVRIALAEQEVNDRGLGKADIDHIYPYRKDAAIAHVAQSQDYLGGCGLGVRVVTGPVIDKWSGPRELWNKQDTLGHDSRRVAAAIVGLLSDRRPLPRALE